jgi:hypothetical protein
MTEKQILKKQKESADASPAKSLLSDLAELRTLLRATGRAYLQRLEGDIDELAVWARMRASDQKMPKAGIRNLGDMVTLVRKLDVKPPQRLKENRRHHRRPARTDRQELGDC